MNSTNKSQNLSNYRVLALNAKYSLINSISVSAVYFICSVLLARYLGAKEFGIIVITNYLLVFINCVFGNDLSGVKLISQHKSQEHNVYVILRGMLCYTILFSLACTLGLLTLYWIPSKFIANNIRPYLLSITIIVVMNLFLGLWNSFWDGFQRMDWAMTTSVVPHTIKTVTFIILIIAASNLKTFMVTWASIWGIYSVIILPLIFCIFLKKYPLPRKKTTKKFPHKTYLMYGLYLKIPGLLKSLTPLAISFYLGHIMMDTYEIGIYGAAASLVACLLIFVMPLGRAFFPTFSQLYEKGEQSYLAGASTVAYQYLSLFVLIIAWIIILWREEIIGLIYGRDFQGAAEVLAYLGIAAFFESLKIISLVVLNAIDRAPVVAVVEVSGAVFLVVGGFILIKYFGVIGAAIAVAIISTLTSMIMLVMLQRLSKIVTYKWSIKSVLALLAFVVVIHWKNGGWYALIPLFITIYLFAKGTKFKEIQKLLALAFGRMP